MNTSTISEMIPYTPQIVLKGYTHNDAYRVAEIICRWNGFSKTCFICDKEALHFLQSGKYSSLFVCRHKDATNQDFFGKYEIINNKNIIEIMEKIFEFSNKNPRIYVASFDENNNNLKNAVGIIFY